MDSTRQAREEQGAAMIIAIFAMVFLLGVSAILFSMAFGENSRTINNVTQQKAMEAANSGAEQGVAATILNPTSPSSASNIDSNGLNTTTSDCGATPTWIDLSNTGSTAGAQEQKNNQEQAYCYTVRCPVALTSTGLCPSVERIITAFGRARNYARSGAGATPSRSYTFQQTSVRVRILP